MRREEIWKLRNKAEEQAQQYRNFVDVEPDPMSAIALVHQAHYHEKVVEALDELLALLGGATDQDQTGGNNSNG